MLIYLKSHIRRAKTRAQNSDSYPKPSNTGFTLIEVVVAAGIIATVMVAFALFIANIAKVQDSAALNRTATRVMSSQLEKISGAKWDDLMMPPVSGAVTPCVINSTRTSFQVVQPGPTTITSDGLPVSVLQSVVWYSTVAPITNVVGDGSTITYTATNSFTIGQVISVYGVTPYNYNVVDATVTSATGTQFSISGSATGTYTNGGNAGLSVYCSGTKDANDLKVATVTVTWLDTTATRTASTSILRSKWTSGAKLN